jgi:hypothetical protein
MQKLLPRHVEIIETIDEEVLDVQKVLMQIYFLLYELTYTFLYT